jgi:hypothetical protein
MMADALMNPAQNGEKLGLMICGHGSRNRGAVQEFAQLAEGLRERFPDWPVEYGYLEFANPVIKDGLDKLRDQGCTRILAVPGMLFAAGHAKNDIPVRSQHLPGQHPGVSIDYGRELAVDPRMIRAAGARIQEALDASDSDVPLHETLLMVVGTRRLRSGCQFQRRQDHPDAVGRLRLRLGGDLLFRRDLPARRSRGWNMPPSLATAASCLSVFPVLRRAGVADLQPHGRRRGTSSGDRIPQGRLSERPSAGDRHHGGPGAARSFRVRT